MHIAKWNAALALSLLALFCSGLQVNAQTTESIDKILSKWNEGKQPGGAVGVFRDGKAIYSKGFGLANLEYEIKNDSRSVFRIGSTSKQFTAACIVLLSQQGKLDLDDPVSKFFPQFSSPTKDVTVRQLLHHTSGIRDYLVIAYLKGLGGQDYYQDRDVMNWMVKQKKLDFPAGSRYQYSNSGYWLLGQIVEKASGKSMAEFAKKEIFQPLGMNDTHFHNNYKSIVSRRSSGYSRAGDKKYEIDMTNLEMIGDGGIFSTVEDMKKWDDAYYKSSVLDQKFWKQMTTVGKLKDGKKIDYACGLIIGKFKGLDTVEHGGAFAGFRSAMVRFPSIKGTVVVLGNRSDLGAGGLAKRIASVAFKDSFPKAKEKKKADKKNTSEDPKKPKKNWTKVKLDQAAGSYQVQPGIVLKITVAGDKLAVKQLWNGSSYQVEENKDGRFQIPGNKGILFGFAKLKDGKAQDLIVLQGGRESIFKRTKEFKSLKKNSQFVGTYSSQELETDYVVEVRDGKLTMKFGRRKAVDLVSAGENKFLGGGVEVEFVEKDGSVTGFSLDAGRANGFEFQKVK